MDAECITSEKWIGCIAVVRATGAVDMLTSPDLQSAIGHALGKGPAALIVDLSEVDFLSSAGMQVLMSAHDEVTRNARFAVVADGPGTSRPLEITRLTDIIDLFATLDAAVDSLTE